MAEIAVSFLLDQLRPFLLEEARLLGVFKQEVAYIKVELEKMKAFLSVADATEETDPQLQVWVKLVRDVAYDTEDVLDEFILRLEHNHGDGCYGFLCKIAYSIRSLRARHRIASEIQRIKLKVNNVSGIYSQIYREHGSSSAVTSNAWKDDRGDALLLEESELVGIHKPKEQILTWLLEGASPLKVVSVVGMGGSGKTTLVNQVFKDEQVKRKFQSHAWITVSQSFDIVDLMQDLIKQLYDEIKEELPERAKPRNINTLKQVVKEFLQARRYIVVLDDVWNTHAWDAITIALPKGNCGSRVLLTTRVLDVASASNIEFHGHIYELKGLSDEESWTLFCNKAFKGKPCPQNLEQISRDILRKCEGLPLAIVVFGGVLALNDISRVDEWVMVLRSLSAELESSDKLERIKRILSLSYYDLPYYIKICFLYLTIYPEDFKFKIKKTIQLWIAEGFVQETTGKTIEEVAQGYFTELLNRSLIQVAEARIDGSPKTCRIHNLVSEIILSKSSELNIVTVGSDRVVRWPETVRRLVLNKPLENVQERMPLPRLRSLLVRGGEFSSVFSLISGGCKFLKLLDLSLTKLSEFPDEVCELIQLRYLSMRNTKVSIVPKYVGKLQKLETLDLKYTHVTKLPIEIGKLHKLRNLIVCGDNFSKRGFEMPAEIGKLSSLRILNKIKANHGNGDFIIREIGKLTQLRTLRISRLRREDSMTLCSSIEKLRELRSLSVYSAKSWMHWDTIDLESLCSGPPFLQKLRLLGRLEKVPRWIPSLYSLMRLDLFNSGLTDDPLQFLQHLPNLIDLRLKSGAYVGERLCFKVGGFQKLKKFSLVNSVVRLIKVEFGAMPHLVNLKLSWCSQLEELPSGIEHLHNLQKLELLWMPNSLVEPLLKRDTRVGDYCRVAHIPQVIFSHTSGIDQLRKR